MLEHLEAMRDGVEGVGHTWRDWRQAMGQNGEQDEDGEEQEQAGASRRRVSGRRKKEINYKEVEEKCDRMISRAVQLDKYGHPELRGHGPYQEAKVSLLDKWIRSHGGDADLPEETTEAQASVVSLASVGLGRTLADRLPVLPTELAHGDGFESWIGRPQLSANVLPHPDRSELYFSAPREVPVAQRAGNWYLVEGADIMFDVVRPASDERAFAIELLGCDENYAGRMVDEEDVEEDDADSGEVDSSEALDGEQRRHCDLCNRWFVSEHALQVHLRISPQHRHSSETVTRPAARAEGGAYCKVCDRHFRSEHALDVHIRVSPMHANERLAATTPSIQSVSSGTAEEANGIRKSNRSVQHSILPLLGKRTRTESTSDSHPSSGMPKDERQRISSRRSEAPKEPIRSKFYCHDCERSFDSLHQLQNHCAASTEHWKRVTANKERQAEKSIQGDTAVSPVATQLEKEREERRRKRDVVAVAPAGGEEHKRTVASLAEPSAKSRSMSPKQSSSTTKSSIPMAEVAAQSPTKPAALEDASTMESDPATTPQRKAEAQVDGIALEPQEVPNAKKTPQRTRSSRKTFYCDECHRAFVSDHALQVHLWTSKQHEGKLAKDMPVFNDLLTEAQNTTGDIAQGLLQVRRSRRKYSRIVINPEKKAAHPTSSGSSPNRSGSRSVASREGSPEPGDDERWPILGSSVPVPSVLFAVSS